MPTLLRWNGFRFFFYSADGSEPAHVHVVKDGNEAKIWLENLAVAVSVGFSARDLGSIVKRTREERDRFLEAWHEHFADRG